MKLAAQTTFSERAGRTIGWMWRGFVRLDLKAHGRLVAQGLKRVRAGAMPVGLASLFTASGRKAPSAVVTASDSITRSKGP